MPDPKLYQEFVSDLESAQRAPQEIRGLYLAGAVYNLGLIIRSESIQREGAQLEFASLADRILGKKHNPELAKGAMFAIRHRLEKEDDRQFKDEINQLLELIND